jgi:hypothetical protein
LNGSGRIPGDHDDPLGGLPLFTPTYIRPKLRLRGNIKKCVLPDRDVVVVDQHRLAVHLGLPVAAHGVHADARPARTWQRAGKKPTVRLPRCWGGHLGGEGRLMLPSRLQTLLWVGPGGASFSFRNQGWLDASHKLRFDGANVNKIGATQRRGHRRESPKRPPTTRSPSMATARKVLGAAHEGGSQHLRPARPRRELGHPLRADLRSQALENAEGSLGDALGVPGTVTEDRVGHPGGKPRRAWKADAIYQLFDFRV